MDRDRIVRDTLTGTQGSERMIEREGETTGKPRVPNGRGTCTGAPMSGRLGASWHQRWWPPWLANRPSPVSPPRAAEQLTNQRRTVSATDPAARLTLGVPWLCVPSSRRVCPSASTNRPADVQKITRPGCSERAFPTAASEKTPTSRPLSVDLSWSFAWTARKVPESRSSRPVWRASTPRTVGAPPTGRAALTPRPGESAST